MAVAQPIHDNVTHLGAHWDEFVADTGLREFGEDEWPGISKATLSFLDNPEAFKAEDLIALHRLPIGTCGGPYDEHGRVFRYPEGHPKARKRRPMCSARLVYELLGIGRSEKIDVYTRAAWQQLIRHTTWADRFTGVDWQDDPNKVKRRWRRLHAIAGPIPTDVFLVKMRDGIEELIHDTRRDIRDFLNDSMLYHRAFIPLQTSLVHRVIPINDKEFRFGIIRRDDPVAGNSHSRNAAIKHGAHLVLKFAPSGNASIFLARNSGLDQAEVVIAVRLLELARRGIIHSLTRAELLAEKCELCPWWYFLRGSQTLLNGSDQAARGVEATYLTEAELVEIILRKTRTMDTSVKKDDDELEEPKGPDYLDMEGPVPVVTQEEPIWTPTTSPLVVSSGLQAPIVIPEPGIVTVEADICP